MKYGLLIAEKSSARKDIEAIYNKHKSNIPYKLDFEQFHGHVVRQKMPEDMRPEWAEWNKELLPMVPSESEWSYIPESDPKRYNAVKKAIESGKYDFIINAGDYEREGQLIQDAFFSTLDIKIPIYRLWGNDLSENEVIRGLNNLLSPEDTIPGMGTVANLSKSSFIRARMDWLIGLNSTRALTLRGGTTIRSGRVKIPILKILADREVAIQEFEVRPFWTVRANFKLDNGETYEGILFDPDENKNIQYLDQTEAEAVVFGPDAKVKSVSKKSTKEKAPKLYSIGTLQGDASEVYGISMSDSLAAVQYLYEKKIVSYPRTDSSHITTEEIDKYFDGLNSLSSIEGLDSIPLPNDKQQEQFKKNKQYVDNSKVKGHSALTVLPGVNIAYNQLSDIQQKVLYLIGRSMLLSFMDPVVKDKTEIVTESNGLLFKTTGSVMSDPGWSKYVPEYGSKSNELPDVQENSHVVVDSHDVKEGRTTPPSRYTVKSLMSVLENIHRLIEDDEEKEAIKEAEGLGRPSTRTSILDEMVENKYIFTKGNKGEYHVTPFGVSIIKSIGHTKLASPELSAHYETLLQHIEDGTEDYMSVYDQVVDYTKRMVDELLNTPISLIGAPQKGRKVVYEGNDGYIVYESKNGYYDDIFMEWMSSEQKGDRKGLWIPKKIDTPKMKLKGNITNKDVINLLDGKEVKKKIAFNNDGPSDRVLSIVNGELKISSGGPKASDVEVEEFISGGQEVKFVTGIKGGKEFAFYRIASGQTIFANSFGYNINKEDLELLIKGESITRPLVNKKGVIYEGILTLGDTKLELSFPEREKEYFIDEPGLRVELIEGENEKGKYAFYKVNNQFIIGKKLSGLDVNEEMIRVLASGEKYHSTQWKNKEGKSFSASVYVEDSRVKFKFDTNYLIDETDFKVELIEGKNKNGAYSFYRVNDEFVINTTFSGREITEDDLRILAETGRLFSSDWVSKKGNRFSANLIVEDGRVRFDFS